MAQRLGRYRHRVVIQKRSETLARDGEPVESWSAFATRWATRRVLSGAEGFEEDVMRQGERMVEFRTHLTRGVGTKMRVLQPGQVTTLTAAVNNATGTSLSVNDADGFPLEGSYRIRVADELMEVTAGQGTQSWTVTRGVDGTTAGTYSTGQAVQLMQPHDIEDARIDWERGAETVIQARLAHGVA